MKVLGIDPGLATTGWGVISSDGRGGYRAHGFGVIMTPASGSMAERLQSLAQGLREVAREQTPQLAAIEELFFAKNSRTAASVGHGRGVALYTLAELGLPITEYNPRAVKIALTGYGAADKFQMQHMIQRMLGLREIPRPDDAADALAIALCHLNTSRPVMAS